MKKRFVFYSLFYLGLALSFLCFFLLRLPSPSPAQVPLTTTEIRGVWLTNVNSGVLFVPGGVTRAFRQLSQLNFNTVYPVVWNRGETFYPSVVAKQFTGHSRNRLLRLSNFGRDGLKQMVKQGHSQGLRVIPWFEYGFLAPANSELVQRHPDWLTQDKEGHRTLNQSKMRLFGETIVVKQVLLNPLYPEVRQFIKNLILEVVTQYDVDGIQLDDHFSLPVEFGYDDYTSWLYKQENGGKSPPNDPFDAEWVQWRAEKLTEVMGEIYQAVKAVKPNCLISLSPNSQGFSYKYYLQDWQTWVNLGYVEELILQVYRDEKDTFVRELEQSAVKRAKEQIPVGVGILTGLVGHPVPIEQIAKQVKLARSQGLDGVSFFYWESLWSYLAPESPHQRRETFQGLFSQDATPPQIAQ